MRFDFLSPFLPTSLPHPFPFFRPIRHPGVVHELYSLSTAFAGQDNADKLIRRAFAKGYLSVVTPGSQISPSSLEIKWEEELRLTIKGALLHSPAFPQFLALRLWRKKGSS